MSRIALIVGNGLLFDFLSWSGLGNEDWHPQSPSRWRKQPVLPDGRSVLSVLPLFAAYIEDQRSRDLNVTDFDIFNKLVQRPAPKKPWEHLRTPEFEEISRNFGAHMRMDQEARHFLLLALSFFYCDQIAPRKLYGWKWVEWLNEFGSRIDAVASFNYDLLAESALKDANISYRRPSLSTIESGRVVIHKPHGSIDFKTSERAVSATLTYPLSNVFSRLDVPIELETELLSPRLNAALVLPAEASDFASFQWVERGRIQWRKSTSSTESLVLLGLSYWECDQVEIDDLVSSLPRCTSVYMCNPKPSLKWLNSLRVRFGDANVHCSDGPPNIQ